jgi:hypothetical protein
MPINMGTNVKLSCKQAIMAQHPENKFKSVNAFGRCFFINRILQN